MLVPPGNPALSDVESSSSDDENFLLDGDDSDIDPDYVPPTDLTADNTSIDNGNNDVITMASRKRKRDDNGQGKRRNCALYNFK